MATVMEWHHACSGVETHSTPANPTFDAIRVAVGRRIDIKTAWTIGEFTNLH